MSAFPCPRCDAEIEPEDDLCPACSESLVESGFLITALLGNRETGRVYVAFREDDGLRVAIKMRIMPEGENWTGFEHVAEGMRVLQGLDHPGVPEVYGVHHDGRGRVFIIREIFDGGTLEERIEAGSSIPQPVGFLAEMLRLLTYLHDQSPTVLHRDIKPSNIAFRTQEDWHPVLVDFDTAMTSRESPATPGFAAPEALEGNATVASDLYSLGVTLLYAATARAPEDLERRGGRFWLLNIEALQDVALRQVVMRLVEPNRWRRFQHANDALQILLKHPSTLDQPVIDLAAPPHVGPPRIRRNPIVRIPDWARRTRRRVAQHRWRRGVLVGLAVAVVVALSAALIWGG